MNVVQFQRDMTGSLRSLDDLRAKVESGEIVMWTAVGVSKDDTAILWVGSLPNAKTKLQWIGALTHLLLSIWHEEIK